MGLTFHILDDIISPKMERRNSVMEADGTAFVRYAISNISGNGRKRLKSVAESLLAVQNRPGFPVPNSVRREIMREFMGSSSHKTEHEYR